MSRTSLRSRMALVLPTRRTGSCWPRSIIAICCAIAGAMNAAVCRGPVWLNGRVTMTSRPSSGIARSPSCSCASLLCAYGLAGDTGESSVKGESDEPYTAAEPVSSTRLWTPARRSASNR